MKNKFLRNDLIIFYFSLLQIKRYFLLKFVKKIFKFIKDKTINFFVNYKFNRLILLKFIYLVKFKSVSLKQSFFINKFVNKFIIGLTQFLNNKTTIIVILKQLTKNTDSEIFFNLKKRKLIFNLLKLRKFEELSYFRFNLNFVYNFLILKQTVKIIPEFLNLKFPNLKKVKIINIYFKFIENILKLFLINEYYSNLIKIIFKGNLLKNKRATKKIITVNKTNSIMRDLIQKLKVNNNLSYNQLICFTIKGTISIKIFIKL